MEKNLDSEIRKISSHPKDRLARLRALSLAEQSVVLQSLSPYVQEELLRNLKINEIVDILDHLDLQQARRIVTRIHTAKRREAVVKRLKGEIKEKLEYFLRFHPMATLSLVNFNYLFLSSDLTVGEAAHVIEEHYLETGRYPELLVHEKGRLAGEVAFATLVKERNSSQLRKYIQPIPTITYQANIDEVVQVVTTAQSKKIVILDQDESVLGIVYADAAKTLLGELPAESLYEFTGVDTSERPFDSFQKKVANRYRWLILNLVTTFVAGSVILMFQDTLDRITILSIYIPVVAGMAGNAASQAFAVTLRGITLGAVKLSSALPVIKNEAIAGLINGLIIGTAVAIISSVWNGSPLLGLSVGLALVCNHILAPVAGATLPLVLKYFGKDPAATSSIFITTVTDVMSLMFLFGFATIILL